MAYKIVISSLPHLDEYEAYEWYEQQLPGLGEELLTELETAYHKISLQPELFGFIDDRKELRDYLLPRFPFLIVYRINGNTAEVITVHHAKSIQGKNMVTRIELSLKKLFYRCSSKQKL